MLKAADHASDHTIPTVMDTVTASNVPRNFRTSSQVLPGVDMTLFNALRISGSAQPGTKGMESLLGRLHELNGDGPVVMVNLRHAPLVCAWDNVFSQYGVKNWAYPEATGADIRAIEEAWLKDLSQHQHVDAELIHSMNDDGTIKHSEAVHGIEAKDLSTVEAAAQAAGFVFKRFYILDHRPPTWDQLMDMKQWYQALPKPKPWLHFHCRKGQHRTSYAHAVVAIINYAERLDLDPILDFVQQMGGVDLRSSSGEPAWKVPYIQQGLAQLKSFHSLCKAERIVDGLLKQAQAGQHLVICLRSKADGTEDN